MRHLTGRGADAHRRVGQLTSRLAGVVLAAALLITACGSEEFVSGFDADPGPIDTDLQPALAEGADPERVPEVERNFLANCVKGGGEELPDLEPVQQEGLLAVCGCNYLAIVGHSFDEARDALDDDGDAADEEELAERAFEIFTEIDDDMRNADVELDDAVEGLVADCIRSEAGL